MKVHFMAHGPGASGDYSSLLSLSVLCCVEVSCLAWSAGLVMSFNRIGWKPCLITTVSWVT